MLDLLSTQQFSLETYLGFSDVKKDRFSQCLLIFLVVVEVGQFHPFFEPGKH